MSDSLPPHGLSPTRLLCPWNSPGKNTGVSSHALLQGIFLTQGSNPGLLHCRQVLYHLSHQEARYDALGARITSLSSFGDQLFGNSGSKFVQVFVEHQLFWAEPFAEHCGEHGSGKRNSLHSHTACDLDRETIQFPTVRIQCRKQVNTCHGAEGGRPEEGAQRSQLWVHENISGRETGLELGLIISALIFREGKKKTPNLKK